MTTEIVEYRKTEAALAGLEAQYRGVLFDCTTREGLQAAIKGRAELRGYRVALEKTRKEIKADALKLCQKIDSEARRIEGELVTLEYPIDQQIKKEEERKEREAEEARQREIRRKANELTDAREMLATFKQRFGHLEQFAPVVKAINACLAKKAA